MDINTIIATVGSENFIREVKLKSFCNELFIIAPSNIVYSILIT